MTKVVWILKSGPHGLHMVSNTLTSLFGVGYNSGGNKIF